MIGANVSLAGVIQLLRRRRNALLISGLVTASLAFAVSRILPLQYASEGNLVLENHATAAEGAANSTIVNSVTTQIEVLRSKGLIRTSLHDFPTLGLVPTMRLPAALLGWLTAARHALTTIWHIFGSWQPGADKTEDLVIYIQRHLSVEAQANSSVISVEFRGGTPDAAASVVNAIMARYVATITAARDAGVAKADQWIDQEAAAIRQEISAAEQRVTQFVQGHRNLSEVQGSLTAAVQLSRDENELTLAQEELAKHQAALETLSRGGGSGAKETLESKSIQNLKEQEGRTFEQLSALTSYDPRRQTLRDRINGIRSQIDRETKLVTDSIARNTQIARTHVQALEAAVQRDALAAQNSTVALATLRQLTADLEAKRQTYVAIVTRAGQVRLAALQAPSAHVLFQAVPQSRPVYSFGVISIVLGFISGVIAASAAVVMRSTLSLRINSTNDMATVTGLPIIGSLPVFKRHVALPHEEQLITETFRAMWATMLSSQGGGKAILVTSSDLGEGKTTIATVLARRLSDDGFRVLLVDGDLRRPRLANMHGLPPANRFESMLEGAATLEEAVLCAPGSDLDLLPADGSLDNPVRALASDRYAQFLAAARRTYDFVVLDSPPVLRVADAILMARLCQHVVFVVQAGRVAGDLINEATQRFSKEDRNKISTLLIRVRTANTNDRDYYSGYRIAGS